MIAIEIGKCLERIKQESLAITQRTKELRSLVPSTQPSSSTTKSRTAYRVPAQPASNNKVNAEISAKADQIDQHNQRLQEAIETLESTMQQFMTLAAEQKTQAIREPMPPQAQPQTQSQPQVQPTSSSPPLTSDSQQIRQPLPDSMLSHQQNSNVQTTPTHQSTKSKLGIAPDTPSDSLEELGFSKHVLNLLVRPAPSDVNLAKADIKLSNITRNASSPSTPSTIPRAICSPNKTRRNTTFVSRVSTTPLSTTNTTSPGRTNASSALRTTHPEASARKSVGANSVLTNGSVLNRSTTNSVSYKPAPTPNAAGPRAPSKPITPGPLASTLSQDVALSSQPSKDIGTSTSRQSSVSGRLTAARPRSSSGHAAPNEAATALRDIVNSGVTTRRTKAPACNDDSFDAPQDSLVAQICSISKEEEKHVKSYLWTCISPQEVNEAIKRVNDHLASECFDRGTACNFISEQMFPKVARLTDKKAKAALVILVQLKRLKMTSLQDKTKVYRVLGTEGVS